MKKLRPRDKLCITSIDRLGRNYEEIQKPWRVLTREKKVDILIFECRFSIRAATKTSSAH